MSDDRDKPKNIYDDIYSRYGQYGNDGRIPPVQPVESTPPTAEFGQIDESVIHAHYQQSQQSQPPPEPTVPVEPVAPPTPPPSPKKKRRSRGALIAVIIFLILTIVALAAVVVVLLMQHRTQAATPPTPVAVPTTSTSVATSTSTSATSATTTSSTSTSTSSTTPTTTSVSAAEEAYRKLVSDAGLKATGFNSLGCLANDKWKFASISTGGKHVLICESAESGKLYYTHDYMPEIYRKEVTSSDTDTGTFQIVNDDATIDITKTGLVVKSKKGKVSLESTFEQSFTRNPYP